MIARSKLTSVKSWLTIARSWLTTAKSGRRVESPIFIRLFSLNAIVDRVVGHDSPGFASSDGADFIMERTGDDRRAETPLKTDVILLF